MARTAAFPADAGLDELLSLAGRKYSLEFEPVSVDGVRLDILQIANMREILDAALAQNALADAVHALPLWAKIWPASLILAHVLRQVPPAGHRLLEVGAGCGLTGLMAAAFGFERVLITDINEDALLFARINVLKNNLQDRVEVAAADIRSDDLNERFTLICGSEILYLDYLYRPLVKFLKRHLAPSGTLPAPEVYLATDHRRSAKPFFKKAAQEFAVSHKPVGVRENVNDNGTADERPERHLLTLHRLRPLF